MNYVHKRLHISSRNETMLGLKVFYILFVLKGSGFIFNHYHFCKTFLLSHLFNPIALRKAKIVYNFGFSECSRVKERICSYWSQFFLFFEE